MLARIVAMSLTLTACGAGTTSSISSTATLTGRVTAGPTCPVERPDHPCPPAPVPATVRARDAHGAVVATAHTDADGGYRLQLHPGAYTVVAATPSQLPRCSPVNVIVKANHTARVAISCDTGIR
jgi:hypothetical protein